MTSTIPSLVAYGKYLITRSFLGKIRVAYFSVKHSYLCNKKLYNTKCVVNALQQYFVLTKQLSSWYDTVTKYFLWKTNLIKKGFQASTRFEPRTSVIPEQLSNQLSFEATTGRAAHFLACSSMIHRSVQGLLRLSLHRGVNNDVWMIVVVIYAI